MATKASAAKPPPPPKPAPKAPAKAPAKTAAGKSAKPRRGNRGILLLIVVAAAIGVAVPPFFILFTAGMAPTIVAFICDRDPDRSLTRSVAAMNLAGMVPPLVAVTRVGLDAAGVQSVLANTFIWLVIYGAAAVGWLIHLAMPAVARGVIDLRASSAERQLEARAKLLVKTWGEEVAGRSGGGQ
jgi:hypothetical protein